MKKEYDFSNGVRSKFFRAKKIQKTIRLDEDILEHFKNLSARSGVPYQTLINLTLRKFMCNKQKIII